jgi:bacteriocin-like protein
MPEQPKNAPRTSRMNRRPAPPGKAATNDAELSDEELKKVSGGRTSPRTSGLE